MSVQRKLWVGILTTAFVLIGVGSDLHATTMVRLTEAQMLQKADWVGIAEIRGTHSEWINRRLWTMVDLQVSESFKGQVGASVTLVVPGGRDAERGLAYVVPGVPAVFPRGGRMLVFGQKSAVRSGGLDPVGMMQGMLFIDRDSSGDAVAIRSGSELQIQARGPQDKLPESERLSVLRDRIRSLIDGAAKGESR